MSYLLPDAVTIIVPPICSDGKKLTSSSTLALPKDIQGQPLQKDIQPSYSLETGGRLVPASIATGDKHKSTPVGDLPSGEEKYVAMESFLKNRLAIFNSATSSVDDKNRARTEMEAAFAKCMEEEYGWTIVRIDGDGACLFRSVAHQLYGDQERHVEVRRRCVEYMLQNKSQFEPAIAHDFESYMERMSHPTTYGDHYEIVAMSAIFNIQFQIYEYSKHPRSLHEPYDETKTQVRLSFHGDNHYNSLIPSSTVDSWRGLHNETNEETGGSLVPASIATGDKHKTTPVEESVCCTEVCEDSIEELQKKWNELDRLFTQSLHEERRLIYEISFVDNHLEERESMMRVVESRNPFFELRKIVDQMKEIGAKKCNFFLFNTENLHSNKSINNKRLSKSDARRIRACGQNVINLEKKFMYQQYRLNIDNVKKSRAVPESSHTGFQDGSSSSSSHLPLVCHHFLPSEIVNLLYPLMKFPKPVAAGKRDNVLHYSFSFCLRGKVFSGEGRSHSRAMQEASLKALAHYHPLIRFARGVHRQTELNHLDSKTNIHNIVNNVITGNHISCHVKIRRETNLLQGSERFNRIRHEVVLTFKSSDGISDETMGVGWTFDQAKQFALMRFMSKYYPSVKYTLEADVLTVLMNEGALPAYIWLEGMEGLDGSITPSPKILESALSNAQYNIEERTLRELPKSFEKEVASGSYGKVSLMYLRDQVVALKSATDRNSSRNQLEREFLILKTLAHPSIITLFGKRKSVAAACPTGDNHRLEEEEEPSTIELILEYCPYDAQRYLEQEKLKGFTPFYREIIGYARELANAIMYVHEKGYLHRDIKPNNVLLTRPYFMGVRHAKLADFGLACKAASDGFSSDGNFPGTTAFKSPEVGLRGYCNSANDVWAYACTVWSFFCGGQTPYEVECPEDSNRNGKENAEIFERWMFHNVWRPNNQRLIMPPQSNNTELNNLLAKCWSYNHEMRPTMQDIVDFFNINY